MTSAANALCALQIIKNLLKVSSMTLLDPKTLDIMVDPVSRVGPTMRQIVPRCPLAILLHTAAAGNCKHCFHHRLLLSVSEQMTM